MGSEVSRWHSADTVQAQDKEKEGIARSLVVTS